MVKNDRWIRQMALEHKMIEPFSERLIGKGVISYGLSSYGYDLRIADEFKIFTPVNLDLFKTGQPVIVDPKNFNQNSFVDYRGEVCVIPPGSFALGRSVEYFRIPRNILVVCLGKSTYARCFKGDTQVALVDGTAPTLEEMAERAQEGEMFWGYSVGPHGRIIVTMLDSPRYVGRDVLIEVVLDTNDSVCCTPDHLFMLRDGRWLAAGQIRPGDSLMPLYRNVGRGYEMVYQPLNGHLYPTHRLADEWNIRNGIYADAPGTHRHHHDGNRRNNNPWNISRVSAREHIQYHNRKSYGDEFDPQEHSAAIREALQRLAQDPQWRNRYSQLQRERALRFWHDEEYAPIRAAVLEQRHNPTEQTRQAHREAMLKRFSDPAERMRHTERMRRAWANDDGTRRRRQSEIARKLWTRHEITADLVRQALDQTGSIRGAAKLLNCDRSVFRRFSNVIRAFRGNCTGRNHKVAAIRDLAGLHDVYCLTVPEAGNFALEAGVFVHNCGIIVNLTPAEPEWEGQLVIEISNTSPLPAKIYANEGIAQMIFLEADELCEISYADRQGKYQKQIGIVTSKVQ
ncbi:dCTP deaminase [Candidatus Acetothermia bacterium]|jgi:dCTP deaminase|nr:dCTP deaminase [Candidatus Acetothermia bacterium]MCI2432287.1 dCTP deaminase [Candidatus Acetothermia bacterium]MCI2437412.1 dCTP deaminase [Candidatus Acetothermia bacterium]